MSHFFRPSTCQDFLPVAHGLDVLKLKEMALFGGVDDEILVFLLERLNVRQFRTGELVFREGDAGEGSREMFVVLEGELEVLKAPATAVNRIGAPPIVKEDIKREASLSSAEMAFGSEATVRDQMAALQDFKRDMAPETRIAILGEYDLFGEMSVLDMQPRSATVRPLSHVKLLNIKSGDMDALYRKNLKAYCMIVQNIARDLSRRLRVTDGLLARFNMNIFLQRYGAKVNKE